jgi:hypothetical protein
LARTGLFEIGWWRKIQVMPVKGIQSKMDSR